MYYIKKSLLILGFLLPGLSIAGDEIYTGYWSDEAVGGYDAVAYFTEGKPVKGSSKFSYEYKDAEWLFSSKENMDKFIASPEDYAPQYGGYCAWAVAQNKTAKGDAKQWSIVDDKLYLNYDADIKKKWLENTEQFIIEGDKNWPDVL